MKVLKRELISGGSNRVTKWRINPTKMKTEQQIRKQNTQLVKEDKDGKYSNMRLRLDLSETNLIEYLTIMDMHYLGKQTIEEPKGLINHGKART